MKKTTAAIAAVTAATVLAGFAGGAVAAGHHGDSQQGQGVKPGNTTNHDTSCSTGGGQGVSATCTSTGSSKADASKRYGNGKTAAQIANGRGAPAGTEVDGPGNSQPHKICGRDVHAYGKGNRAKCGAQHSAAAAVTTTSAVTTTTAATTAAAAPATTAATTTVAAPAAVSAPQAPPPSSGVLGATKAVIAPAHTPSHPTSGVLGAAKTLGAAATHGTLPFTGLRLWIVVLVALGFIGGGVALHLAGRRRLS